MFLRSCKESIVASKRKPLWVWRWVLLTLLLALFLPRAHGQEEPLMQLVGVDLSSFPTVRITLQTLDAQGGPADLSDLALTENGAPISELSVDTVPVGADIIFVLDANNGFNEIDDESGLTRGEKSIASIQRFAEQYMDPNGLDTVSIVVPAEGGQEGRVLIQGASNMGEIEEAIGGYKPDRLGPTPLNAMMDMALERASEGNESGRYQAILLFTDGRRLDQQLSFLQLVAQANDAMVPIYSAILGQTADALEIANVSRLSDPTRAFFVHLTEPSAVDSIYEIFETQSDLQRVSYRSRQRQSGRNQLNLSLGPTIVSTSFELMLEGPEVSLLMEDTTIRRAGTAPDTAVDALQPTSQPFTIAVDWPDGMSRQIENVAVLVDGERRSLNDEWEQNDAGQIQLLWDIRDLQEGSVTLAVEVTDELGYQGRSDQIDVNIVVERPEPQEGPSRVPTEETVSSEPLADDTRWEQFIVPLLLLLLLVALLIWWDRRRRKGETAEVEDVKSAALMDSEHFDSIANARLEPLDGNATESILIEDANVAVGSDAGSVEIVLNDGSVNRLHARIRREERGYWILDEGSFEGTFLNYERLGLAPRKLQDGDVVQFGKVKFRFRLDSDNSI